MTVVLILVAVVIGVVVGNALRRRFDYPDSSDHTDRSDSLDG